MHRVLFLVTACVVMGVEVDGYHKSDDYPDYQLGVKYDEYPMIVPKKRTALLVNRLMVALKEAMQDEERQEALKNNDNLDRLSPRSNKNYALSPDEIRSMDLQRRGHGNIGQQKGRIYWRCYFNAVTCF
ncbi:uncharacterized protein LOC108910605 [Anoplophora glabripennis]|uniref:uncharacterized protein LOC108910605 n=1 Tax=Anoplophora glabripennis TaxID=217634 RepID=UPI000874DAD6|nr:uncharacterized protein LOC108910605 [Anoplophora glabripennis]